MGGWLIINVKNESNSKPKIRECLSFAITNQCRNVSDDELVLYPNLYTYSEHVLRAPVGVVPMCRCHQL